MRRGSFEVDVSGRPHALATVVRVDPPVSARVGGTTTLATTEVDGTTTVAWATVALRDDASAGMRRHELGHLIGLAHNDGSPLMRPTPSPSGDYSSVERDAMRAMAVRSGCR